MIGAKSKLQEETKFSSTMAAEPKVLAVKPKAAHPTKTARMTF